MANTKDLIVVGSYPSTTEGENTLEESLNNLKDHFDIILVTHYPVKKEIQHLVQYYIYDHRNEIIHEDFSKYYFWAWNPDPFFYFQNYSKQPHAFCVYRSIMNAVKLTQDFYEDFFYIEGDCIFCGNDIEKLKSFKQMSKSNGKNAAFFSTNGFFATWAFYSEMDFFKNNFCFPKNLEEYFSECTRIGSYGILENFLYRSIETRNKLECIYKIETKSPTNYFSESKINVTSVIDGNIKKSPLYISKVLPVKETTDQLAFCYLSGVENVFEYPMDVYLDDEKIITLPIGKFSTAIPIYPKNEKFSIKFADGTSYGVDKQTLFNNKEMNYVILNK